MLNALVAVSAACWLVVLLLPWQPWRNRELLAARPWPDARLDDVTVLIPARNEARTLPATLAALARQGPGLRIVVVDDCSEDATAEVARATRLAGLRVVRGRALPPGWTGKLWALAQAEPQLVRPLVLLLDADVTLAPGLLHTLRAKLETEGLDLASLLVALRTSGGWERLLIPPFVYFFKLLYPFALSNREGSRVAAAAGGCILMRVSALRAIGGFASIRDAVIDDCSLAARVKRAGGRIWIGQSLDATSRRRYSRLTDIWEMVARSAYTQLQYSLWRLLACTLAMLVAFVVPVISLLAGGFAALAAVFALALMAVSFLPTLLLYGLPPALSLTLPVAAVLYLLMTWHSAIRYLRGERTRWRGRRYARVP